MLSKFVICGNLIDMDLETSKRLNQLTYDFYQKIGKYWNNKMDYEWDGWVRLVGYFEKVLEKQEKIRVLDLGCGNGRFYHFLSRKFGTDRIEYLGVDYSDYLLGIANESKGVSSRFLKKDLFFDRWDFDINWDFVVSFGLTHHIPGSQNRRRFFERLRNLVIESNSVCILTTWNYKLVPRINKKIKNDSGFNDRLEGGDSIIFWEKEEYGERYSHFYEKSEVIDLMSGLSLVDYFMDDDKTRTRNSYYIFNV